MPEPFSRVTRTPHGEMIYNVNDIWIGRSLAHYGEFSLGEFNLFQEVVPEGGMVVEAGANIGAHTLGFARLVGGKGRVLAFEPQRVVYQTLCGNCALNSLTNVYAYSLALGERAGTMYLPWINYRERNNPGGASLSAGERDGAGPSEEDWDAGALCDLSVGERVEVRTLDSYGLRQVDLIKADVEGHEAALLRGAAETIARCRPFLYVENDRGDPRDLIDLIRALGYDLWWHKPPLFNPDNFNRNAVNVFLFPSPEGWGEYVSLNMFCAPAEKAFQAAMDGWEDAADYERIF